jgi:hypothetical protein
MNEVVVFTPLAQLDAQNNLNNFIEMSRHDLTIFGKDLKFIDNVWDVTAYIELKGHGNKRLRLIFSDFQTVNDKNWKAMSEPFLSFAKSYIRYIQGLRPTKNIAFRISALRAIEKSLIEFKQISDPTLIDLDTLNRAAQLIKENFTDATAYRIGGQLEIISNFLIDNRLTKLSHQWHSSISRPSDTTRVGKQFDERRNEKLPSQRALEALPAIFHLASDNSDLLITSIAAILCSAPDRINEVLLLPDDCEVHERNKDNRDIYGLRWWPAKGANPMIKWIIPSMAEVVEAAIKRIKKVTAPARIIAQWYTLHPNTIFLPNHLEYLRNKNIITLSEVSLILFDYENKDSAKTWCKNNKILLLNINNETYVNFNAVEAVVLTKLPSNFPFLSKEVNLLYSNALFIIRTNELNNSKSTYIGMIEPLSINTVNTKLGSRSQSGFKSIYDKHGFQEENGKPIKVTSHQFRHYLNTLAQAGGLSQLDIAMWSGRKDISQNTVYDHISADELVLKIRSALGDDQQVFGPLAELPPRVIIQRDEFARLKIPTAHVTEFGVCIHDYTMSPCQIFSDCLHCTEHVCIKGDYERTHRIQEELISAKANFEMVKDAYNKNYYGANRWVDHLISLIEKLTQLNELLMDSSIPNGSIIQLSKIPILSPVNLEFESVLNQHNVKNILEIL